MTQGGVDSGAVYLVCFGTGLVLTVVGFAAGFGHGHFVHSPHAPVHQPAGLRWGGKRGGTAGGRFGGRAGGLSFLNGFTLPVFLCWFGGAGYLWHRFSPFGTPLVVTFAAASGLAGAGIVFWLLTGVLLPMERTLEAADTEMAGVIGRLSQGVPAGGFGEMLYSQNGARRSAVVRAEHTMVLPRGAEVIVMRYERGVAYVRQWDEFELGLLGHDTRAGALAEGAPGDEG